MNETALTELAWAAGFFDGEGSSSFIAQKGKGKRVQMQLSQTELEPLERFRDAVDSGAITGPYWHYGADKKGVWKWRTAAQKDVKRVVAILLPYLSQPKRIQALSALQRAGWF